MVVGMEMNNVENNILGKVVELKIDEINPRKQIRTDFNLDLLKKMERNIEKLGLIQLPIVDENNVIVCGERRIRAMKMNGFKTVQARKLKSGTKEWEKLIYMFAENVFRRQISPRETMDGLLKTFKAWKEEETKDDTTKSRKYLYKEFSDLVGVSSKTLTLYDKLNKELIPEALELFREGKLKVSPAKIMVTISKKHQKKALDYVGKGRGTEPLYAFKRKVEEIPVWVENKQVPDSFIQRVERYAQQLELNLDSEILNVLSKSQVRRLKKALKDICFFNYRLEQI